MKRLKLAVLVALVGAFGLMTGCGDDAASSGGKLGDIGDECQTADECVDGLVCENGVCAEEQDNNNNSGGEEFDPCTRDADCNGDLACIEDQCRRDSDGDGVPDEDDNCPDIYNPDQTDSNQNGTGDECEDLGEEGDSCQRDRDCAGELLCISNTCTPVGDEFDPCTADAHCAGDLVCIDDECRSDRDGDGVPDEDDNCPDTPNPDQEDMDGDGDGDACDDDIDGDNHDNDDDNCPYVYNPDQKDTSQNGVGDACDPDTVRRDGRPFDDTCSFDYTTSDLDPELKWSLRITSNDDYPDRNQVMMTPAVANLTDDNGDGSIDESDTADIIFTTFQTNQVQGNWDQLHYGVLRAASGDGSGLHWSVGYEELHQHLPEIQARYAPGGADGKRELERLGIAPAGSIAVGDVDGDGNVDIVAGLWHDQSPTGGVVLIGHDGVPKWVSTEVDSSGIEVPHQFEFWWGGPAIANIDGVGTPEIVVGSMVFDSNGDLVFDGADATGLSGYPGKGINRSGNSGDHYTGALSAVADLDAQQASDGLYKMEIVTGTTAYTHDGDVFWEADASLPDGFVALADFTGDFNPEVVVTADSTIRIQSGVTGEVVWGPVTVEGYDGSSTGGRLGAPTIADFDGDSTGAVPSLEIGIAGGNQYVAIKPDPSTFDANNPPQPAFDDVKLWAMPTQDASSNMTGSSVFDFQGDGRAEVVYNDETTLWVFDGTGNGDGTTDVRFSEPNSTFTALEYPIIVDTNNNGNSEIVVGSNDFECGDQLDCGGNASTGIKVFGDANDSWVGTRRIWNQHTYHITNVREDGSIPSQELDNWYVSNTYRLNELTEIPPQAAPDLIGEDPQADGEACDYDVSVWVTNSGAIRVGSGLPVSFYAVDGSGQRTFLAEKRTRHPLEPGESERLDAQVTLPGQGTWDIEAVVDDVNGTGESTENECDPDNNDILVADDVVCNN
jgi:hypothetical protein